MSLTLLFAFCLAQETEATPADAQGRLARALDKSADRGVMKVEGAVAPVQMEAPEGEEGEGRRRGGFGGGRGGFGGGFEGMFSAVVNSRGDAKVTVEQENSKTEIYRIDGATAYRTVGSGGGGRGLGGLPQELGTILNFADMVREVNRAKNVSIADGTERVGQATCQVYDFAYVPEQPEPEEQPEGEEGRDPRRMMRGMGGNMIREVRAKVWVDDEAGIVRKIAVEMERGPSDETIERMREMMEQRGSEGEGGGEGERPRRGGRGFQIPDRFPATAYEIEILEYLEDGDIEVPDEIKPYLKD